MKYSPAEVARLQQMCKTDLFFLSKEILQKDFTEGTHRQMCEFFVKKDPSFKTFKEFAQQYSDSHDRMMLAPRLTYKSSIKVIDNIQWIINWPEVRLLTATANEDLSTAFINELTAYFVVRGNAERDPKTGLLKGGRPTLFQELFPQHCITEKEANDGEFITPARNSLPANLIYKEPTAGALSISGSSSGWRCDVLDFDDVVSDRNAETGTQLEKLGNRIAMVTELMMNFGFRHTMATRYHKADPYGKVAESHGITELYGDYDKEGLKYFCRPCWWLKGQPFKQPDYKTWVPNEADLDLFFPESSTFKALLKKMKNPTTFFSQQLNSPQDTAVFSFTEDLVRSGYIDHTALPRKGQFYIFWDLAYSTKNYRDYSVGVVALLDDKREWWIVEIIRGRFNFSEKCYQIVKAIKDFRPLRVGIEDVMGSQDSMRDELNRHARSMGVELRIDWVSGTSRTVDDAKLLRMSILHPWLEQKRLHFLNTISCLNDLLIEFTNIGNKHARNDIPDAMSRLVETYTRSAAEITAPSDDDRLREWNELADREFYDLVFQKGKYSPVDLPLPEPAEPEEFIDSMTGLPSPYRI